MHNVNLNSNSFVNQENWNEENINSSDTGNLIANQYKMSNNKIKMGAATSTNFMNGANMNNQQFKMSMLRSVQQNMPNMPNVSNY